MIEVGSLKSRIVLQFLAVVLPISLVLAYQTMVDLRRSDELGIAFTLHGHSHQAKTRYKAFVDGVVDAVDTGQVGTNAVHALGEAIAALKILNAENGARNLEALIQSLQAVQAAVQQNPAISTLLPLKAAINKADADVGREDAYYEELNHKAIVSLLESAKLHKLVVGVAGLITLVITVLFIRHMARGLTDPLRDAVGMANAIAAGTIGVSGRREVRHDIGRLLHSLNAMNDQLHGIISSVKTASDSVSRSADNLSVDATEVLAHANDQAEGISGTRASLQDIGRAMEDVADAASSAVRAASETETIAREGNAKMQKSLEANARIVDTVDASARAIGELTDSVHKISDMSNIIKDIADQTNLLALNAAIEAARAGEQGRGFAVVADEVRKLAERTTASTVDIARMVDAIGTQTGGAVASMNRVKEEVRQGADYSAATSAILQRIVDSAQQVAALANRIADAMHVQSQADDRALANMESIAAVTDVNVRCIRQVHAAAQSLAETAGELQQAVNHFKLS